MSDKIPGSLVALNEPQLFAAILQVPPGRTLAGEYLRLTAYVVELGKQVVRGTELRIAAEQRAGKRNVGRLEERIEQLERELRYKTPDWTWYMREVLLDEIDEDP